MNLSFYQAAELIEKAIAMPGLSSLQKIEISLSCSYLFQQFGLRRKFIYMLFRTVSLYLEAGDVRAAVHVLILIAELSCAGFRGRNEDKDNQRLDETELVDGKDVMGGEKGRDLEVDWNTWIFLSRAVLRLLAKLSLEDGKIASLAIHLLAPLLCYNKILVLCTPKNVQVTSRQPLMPPQP